MESTLLEPGLSCFGRPANPLEVKFDYKSPIFSAARQHVIELAEVEKIVRLVTPHVEVNAAVRR